MFSLLACHSFPPFKPFCSTTSRYRLTRAFRQQKSKHFRAIGVIIMQGTIKPPPFTYTNPAYPNVTLSIIKPCRHWMTTTIFFAPNHTQRKTRFPTNSIPYHTTLHHTTHRTSQRSQTAFFCSFFQKRFSCTHIGKGVFCFLSSLFPGGIYTVSNSSSSLLSCMPTYDPNRSNSVQFNRSVLFFFSFSPFSLFVIIYITLFGELGRSGRGACMDAWVRHRAWVFSL